MDARVLLLLVVCVCASVLAQDGDKKDCRKILPMKDFDEEKFKGLWYLVRWYLPPSANVSWEYWDYSHYYTTKEEEKNSLFTYLNYREKGDAHCADTKKRELNRIRPGQYHMEVPTFANTTVTVVYTDYHFSVQHICIRPDGDQCEEEEFGFWSRKTKARHQDIMKAVNILKESCYPNMKRFLSTKQEMDCVPASKKCKERGDKKKRDEDGEDDMKKKKMMHDMMHMMEKMKKKGDMMEHMMEFMKDMKSKSEMFGMMMKMMAEKKKGEEDNKKKEDMMKFMMKMMKEMKSKGKCGKGGEEDEDEEDMMAKGKAMMKKMHEMWNKMMKGKGGDEEEEEDDDDMMEGKGKGDMMMHMMKMMKAKGKMMEKFAKDMKKGKEMMKKMHDMWSNMMKGKGDDDEDEWSGGKGKGKGKGERDMEDKEKECNKKFMKKCGKIKKELKMCDSDDECQYLQHGLWHCHQKWDECANEKSDEDKKKEMHKFMMHVMSEVKKKGKLMKYVKDQMKKGKATMKKMHKAWEKMMEGKDCEDDDDMMGGKGKEEMMMFVMKVFSMMKKKGEMLEHVVENMKQGKEMMQKMHEKFADMMKAKGGDEEDGDEMECSKGKGEVISFMKKVMKAVKKKGEMLKHIMKEMKKGKETMKKMHEHWEEKMESKECGEDDDMMGDKEKEEFKMFVMKLFSMLKKKGEMLEHLMEEMEKGKEMVEKLHEMWSKKMGKGKGGEEDDDDEMEDGKGKGDMMEFMMKMMKDMKKKGEMMKHFMEEMKKGKEMMKKMHGMWEKMKGKGDEEDEEDDWMSEGKGKGKGACPGKGKGRSGGDMDEEEDMDCDKKFKAKCGKIKRKLMDCGSESQCHSLQHDLWHCHDMWDMCAEAMD